MSTPPDERDLSYLWDMRASAIRAAAIVESASFEDFGPDSVIRLAVERAIELIGEAARRVSSGFQAAHPAIPWRDIIGQRNVLAHEYGEIDARRLWQTATRDVQQLIAAIDEIIPQAGDSK